MLACGIGIYDRGPVGEQSTLQAAGGGWAGVPRSSTLVPGVCVPVAEDICVLHPFPVLENTFLLKKKVTKSPLKTEKKVKSVLTHFFALDLCLQIFFLSFSLTLTDI